MLESNQSELENDTISEVNTVELHISKIENDLHNWSIPKISVDTFYQKGSFEFSVLGFILLHLTITNNITSSNPSDHG